MSSPGSVSCWLAGLRLGDEAAAQHLWEGYFARLVGLARQKLHGVRPRASDEEDIALSAFHSFCHGAEEGRFPRLNDRQDLWQVLVMLAARKAANVIRYEMAAKRGGQATREAPEDDDGGDRLAQIIGTEPSPSFAMQVAEEYRRLFDRLDEDQRRLALLKMEGLTQLQIAERTGRSLATVERKLALIRRIWEGEARHAG